MQNNEIDLNEKFVITVHEERVSSMVSCCMEMSFKTGEGSNANIPHIVKIVIVFACGIRMVWTL